MLLDLSEDRLLTVISVARIAYRAEILNYFPTLINLFVPDLEHPFGRFYSGEVSFSDELIKLFDFFDVMKWISFITKNGCCLDLVVSFDIF